MEKERDTKVKRERDTVGEFSGSAVMYRDDSVTFDLYCTRTLTFNSSFLYFDPMYECISFLIVSE